MKSDHSGVAGVGEALVLSGFPGLGDQANPLISRMVSSNGDPQRTSSKVALADSGGAAAQVTPTLAHLHVLPAST